MLDDDGVDFLGIRLAVVLIVAALLVSLAAVYVSEYTDRASRDRARQEAGRIVSLARAEYASGTGSVATITVAIPGNVRRMAFGEGDARSYAIEFQDGSKEVRVADCRFSPAALYPGHHLLEVEAVADGGGYAISLREA